MHQAGSCTHVDKHCRLTAIFFLHKMAVPISLSPKCSWFWLKWVLSSWNTRKLWFIYCSCYTWVICLGFVGFLHRQNHIFWTDVATKTIMRSNLDGSMITTIFDTGLNITGKMSLCMYLIFSLADLSLCVCFFLV